MNDTHHPRGGATYVAMRLGGQGAEFIFWIVVARNLAPAQFGVMTIAFLVARYAGLVADWGALTRGARDVASPQHARGVSRLLAQRTRLAVALFCAYGVAAIASGHSEVAALAGVVLGIGLNRDWVALGQSRHTVAGLPTALQGGGLLAASAFATSPSRVAAYVGLSYAVASLASRLLNPAPKADAQGRGAARPDGWMLIALLSIQLTSTADTVLLGILATSREAGIYGAAYRLPNAIVALLGAVMAGYLPRLTSASARSATAFEHMRSTALRRSRFGAAVVLLATPLAAFVFPRIFGSVYGDGRSALVVLMLSMVLVTGIAPLHASLISLNGDRAYALLMSAAAATNLVLNLALIPAHGALGAALSTFVAQGVVAAGLTASSRRASPARDGDP